MTDQPMNTPSDTPGDAAAAAAASSAAGHPEQQGLSGSDAVNLAAEQSKNTAHRNIPPLDLGEYTFGQQLIFAHDGENYLTYESRIWKIDTEGNPVGPDHRESGFWRISLQDEIEIVCTHSTGVAEIFYGEPVNERAWQVESASTMVTSSCAAKLGPGKRLYGLMPNNDLGWVDERLVDGEMRPRMSAQLKRIAG